MNSSSKPEEKPRVDANIERRLRIACLLALVALGLIVFSMLVPKPLPVIVAMSVAQGIGTLSLLIFLHIVSKDVWRVMTSKTDAPAGDSPEKSNPAP
jgi:hypothetical protein